GYVVDHVTLDRNGTDGVAIGPAGGGRIDRVVAWGHPGAGIALRSCFPCRMTITSTVVGRNGTGILLSNAGGDVSITDTEARASPRALALVTAAAPTAPHRYVALAANRLTGGDMAATPGSASTLPEGVGILIAGGRGNRIDRNEITGFAAAGLEIGDAGVTLS